MPHSPHATHCALQVIIHLTLVTACGMGTVIIIISQMRKLRRTGVEHLTPACLRNVSYVDRQDLLTRQSLRMNTHRGEQLRGEEAV